MCNFIWISNNDYVYVKFNCIIICSFIWKMCLKYQCFDNISISANLFCYELTETYSKIKSLKQLRYIYVLHNIFVFSWSCTTPYNKQPCEAKQPDDAELSTHSLFNGLSIMR